MLANAVSRIIPARAGFTPIHTGLPRAAGDHPRSRGVYRDRAIISARFHWIIPARAGFTRRLFVAHVTPMDHPRSRGVYIRSPSLICETAGSSPLARGLPFRSVADGDPVRIIPARAGFTQWLLTPTMSWAGSSPLARGLRHWYGQTGIASRIIPARAGFTAVTQGVSGYVKDHPRSRGVYYPQSTDKVDRNGSSPLARGLPGHAHRGAP